MKKDENIKHPLPGKSKILIVDNKPENLFALENVLSKLDIELIKATNGNDALRETLNHKFALAILDVQMPEMDGYELAELMRNEEKTKHIPIIFLSAVYSDEFHVFKGYKSGAVDFLTKPYNPEIFLDKVNIFIEIDRYKRELERHKKQLEEMVKKLNITNEQLKHEITVRKQAEESLLASERSLADAQQIANLGSWKRNVLTNEVTWSDQTYRLLGLEPKEITPSYKAFLSFVHPDDRESVKKANQEALHKKEPYNIDFRIIRKDGEERALHSQGEVHCNQEGKPISLIVTAQDITKQIKLMQKLARANEEIKTFAHIVSHDLRSPLVNIKGFSHELQKACADINAILQEAFPLISDKKRKRAKELLNDDIPEALSFIDSSTSAMDRMISNILTLARIGSRELHFEEINTNMIVEEKIKTLHHQIESKGIKVNLSGLPNVIADKSALDQVFGNILSNAINYLDPNRLGVIEISGERRKEEILLSVKDNGRGIATEDFHKVFELFRRAGKPPVPGEGMGLAYIKALIERHGGEIWFESEEGVGTTFYFTIPDRDGGQGTDDSGQRT